MQTCTKCNLLKSTENFHKDSWNKNGKRSVCKACIKLQPYKKTSSLREKNSKLKRTYGIDLNFYKKLAELQDNKCPICDKPERILDPRNNKIRFLAVDHHHEDDQIRGLLCAQCNRSLGGFNDDIKLLKRAISYLNDYEEIRAEVKEIIKGAKECH